MSQRKLITCDSSEKELIEALTKGYPISGIEKVITHIQADLDEFCTHKMMRESISGQKMFPGIENSGMGFITNTALKEKNLLGMKGVIHLLQTQNSLLIGAGLGPFDEHTDRDQGISCMNLMARHIRIHENPQDWEMFKAMLNFVNYEDCNGDNILGNSKKVRKTTYEFLKGDEKVLADNLASMEGYTPILRRMTAKSYAPEEEAAMKTMQFGMLPGAIKNAWDVGIAPGLIVTMVETFLNAHLGQSKLLYQAIGEYKKNTRETQLFGQNFLAEIASDNPKMSAAITKCGPMRSKEGRIAFSFIKRSTGNFIVIPKTDAAKAAMPELVKMIRLTVASRLKREIKLKEANAPGYAENLPELYFDETQLFLSNGSKKDDDTPPLLGKCLRAAEICEMIDTAFNRRKFDQKNFQTCIQGVCCAGEKGCSLVRFKLDRCSTMKVAQKEETKKKVTA